MPSITHSQRYLPHTLDTRFYATKLYRRGYSVSFVCRRYKISKSSLMRWNRRFDGTRDSLRDRSHRPHTPHPASHTEQELKWIRDLHRRNPHISVCYSRHPGSLYRVFVRLGYSSKAPSTKKKRHDQPYDTPTALGVKWQMDVKFVPAACYTGTMPDDFYQYTVIDEASRERFIYAYREHSSYSTVDFMTRAFRHFGYRPQMIQTDNGTEFTHTQQTDREHPMDIYCRSLGIEHKLIRPRTPWHNGKVERSHRNDQERFYNFLHFYSYEDLQVQMARYLRRSNNIPMQVLGWLSPKEKRQALLKDSSLVVSHH